MLKCKYADSGLAITNAHDYMRPCCQYKFDVSALPSIDQVNTFDEAVNTPHRKWLLDKLAQGEQVAECKSCWDLESNGILSKRSMLYENTREATYLAKPVTGKLQHMEIALDFTCNMTCRMCHPLISSAWGKLKEMNKELDALPHRGTYSTMQKGTAFRDNMIRLFENSDLSELTWIKLTGGEPFYSKSLKKVVEILIEKAPYQELTFEVITNCSIFPSEEVLNMLKKFKKVRIIVSLDAVGQLAQTIRPPTPWQVTKSVFEQWRDTGFDVIITSTITIMNINRMREVKEWYDEVRLGHWNEWIMLTPLRSPEWLNPYLLPLEIRNHFKIDYSPIDKYILSTETVDEKRKPSWSTVLQSIDIQDKHLIQKLCDTNPEIYNIIEDLYYEELASM